MNPSYFRIRTPLELATERLSSWWGVPLPNSFVETDSTAVVDLACDEAGNWRGGALFFYAKDDWTVFEDVTGGFGAIPAEDWLKFAKNDQFVWAGYNDSIPCGEIVVLKGGEVLREFIDYPDSPEENRDRGTLASEETKPIRSWIEVASFVDSDELAFSEKGLLWINETRQ